MAKGQGYVHRLGLSASFSDHEASSDTGRRHRKEAGEPASPTLPSTTRRTAALALGIGESRQVGDRSVYKHYIKSMGWWLAASSLFYAALWGFLTNFPTICESACQCLFSVAAIQLIQDRAYILDE
jgi:hypothetical protein